MTTPPFIVRIASWHDERDRDRLTFVRREVFVIGQNVAEEIEIDGLDPAQTHFLAEAGDDGEAIGTARLADSGKVGRVAVLESWRGKGVGHAIMKAVIAAANDQGIAALYLHAQTASVAFYEKLGFMIDPAAGEFLEADIPHRRMIRG